MSNKQARTKRFDPVEEGESFTMGSLRDLMNQYNKPTGLPPMEQVQNWFATEESTRDFLIDQHVIHVPIACPHCSNALRPPKGDLVRCHKCKSGKYNSHSENVNITSPKKGNDFSQSIYKGTFLEQAKGGRRQVMWFLYFWLSGATIKQLETYTSWSRSKVDRWITYAHQLICATSCVTTTTTTTLSDNNYKPIGGKGIEVEIDESESGICKQNQRADGSPKKQQEGHPSPTKRQKQDTDATNTTQSNNMGGSSWVFGGIENTPERKVFAVTVEKRDAATLLPLMRQFIAPGSILRSDCWAVDDIEVESGHGYIHETVDHLEDFVDPFVDPTWYAVKRKVTVRKRGGKKQLKGYLFEFMWRRQNEGDLWSGIIQALKDVQYQDPQEEQQHQHQNQQMENQP